MGYFRERAKPMSIGFLIGLAVGWAQPMILGVKPPADLATRGFMIVQMGAAFTIIALFVVNYLAVRRRAYQKYSRPAPKPESSSEKV